MPNKFVNTIVFVSDLERSKHFYADLLNIKIRKDLNTIVFFENQLVLHSAKSILGTIFKEEIPHTVSEQGRNNILIYFECDDLDTFYHGVKNKVKVIHGIQKQDWGQRVFRFYDPDGHIVEFGEPLEDNL